MSTSRQPASTAAPGRMPSMVAAACGLLFALCLFLSLSTVNPVESDTDEGLLTEWADSSLRQDFILSMLFQIVAAGAFIVFFAEVRRRLAQTATWHPWRGLVDALSTAFATLLLVSAIARGAIPFNVEVRDQPLPGADAMRLATAMTDVTMSLVVMPLAALTLLVTGLVMLQAGAPARWLAWSGVGAAAICLAMTALAMGAFAAPLVILWAIAASVHLVRSAGAATRQHAVIAMTGDETASVSHP